MLNKKVADSINWVKPLSDKFKDKLINIGQHITIDQNDHITLQQLPSAGVIYFLKGTAVITMQTLNLKTINNMVFGQGDWVGDYQPQKDSALSFKFSLVGSISIILFENEKLQHLMREDMETYRWLYYISNELKPKWLQSQLLGPENKQVRIIYLLLDLALHSKQSKVNTKLIISQQELSEMIGISRQRVNEVLIHLQSMDYISLERNCINLLNIKGLSYLLNNLDLSIRDPRIDL